MVDVAHEKEGGYYCDRKPARIAKSVPRLGVTAPRILSVETEELIRYALAMILDSRSRHVKNLNQPNKHTQRLQVRIISMSRGPVLA